MNVFTLLQDADPLRYETGWTREQRLAVRSAVIDASERRAPSVVVAPRLLVFAAAIAAMFVVLSVVGHYWQRGSDQLIAAVRFEVHLAENQPGSGLREVTVGNPARKIYLHSEVIASNADIAEAHVVQATAGSSPSVGITFNAAGAAKMAQATKTHLGRPIAILVDGQVVMAPTVRSPIGAAANINGDFTQDDVNRIVQGIVGQ